MPCQSWSVKYKHVKDDFDKDGNFQNSLNESNILSLQSSILLMWIIKYLVSYIYVSVSTNIQTFQMT